MPISKAQANQRAGRAGREGPGNCYRLYTEVDYEQRDETQKSEMERCALTEVILELLSLNVGDVYNFDYLTPPSKHVRSDFLMRLSFIHLLAVNQSCIERTENAGCRVPRSVGRQISL